MVKLIVWFKTKIGFIHRRLLFFMVLGEDISSWTIHRTASPLSMGLIMVSLNLCRLYVVYGFIQWKMVDQCLNRGQLFTSSSSGSFFLPKHSAVWRFAKLAGYIKKLRTSDETHGLISQLITSFDRTPYLTDLYASEICTSVKFT